MRKLVSFGRYGVGTKTNPTSSVLSLLALMGKIEEEKGWKLGKRVDVIYFYMHTLKTELNLFDRA